MKKALRPELWNKLVVLGEKQGAIRLSDLSVEMGLGPEETLAFLRQVFPVGSAGIEIYSKDSECWVDIKGESIQYMLPLSPGEWIQLHQILNSHKSAETAVMHSLRKKVTENGPIKVVMELLSQLELWDQELNEVEQVMIQQLDLAINEKQLLCLMAGEKSFTVHPCRVLHLEGQLTLIAEDFQDHCLLVIPLKDVKDISPVPSMKVPKVTPYEIEEFISAIRAMNEKETRLILKIHDPSTSNLFPDHQFLGKPCMITNPNGDLIWAAYVEPCEALYEWILTLGKNVEILDPVKFKDEYLIYCEEKLRKIA